MTPTITEALTLMLIGMITVFSILTIVVLAGKTLISISNKMVTDTVPVKRSTNALGIPPEHVAAITATVHTITQGRGHIEDIVKSK